MAGRPTHSRSPSRLNEPKQLGPKEVSMKAQKVRLTLPLALILSSFAVPLCAQTTTPIFVEGRFEILDKLRHQDRQAVPENPRQHEKRPPRAPLPRSPAT